MNWYIKYHRQLTKPTHSVFRSEPFIRFPNTKYIEKGRWRIINETIFVCLEWASVKWKLNSSKAMLIYSIYSKYFKYSNKLSSKLRSLLTDYSIKRDWKRKVIFKIKNGHTWLCDSFLLSLFTRPRSIISLASIYWLANFLWHLVLDWYLS